MNARKEGQFALLPTDFIWGTSPINWGSTRGFHLPQTFREVVRLGLPQLVGEVPEGRWGPCGKRLRRIEELGYKTSNIEVMMKADPRTRPFDAAEYFDSAEAIAAYLEAAFEEDDSATIVDALGTVAKAKGMTEIISKTGLSRESLYKARSAEGNPEFATILKVIRGLDLKTTARGIIWGD